jgi:hypothetical protein
VVDVRVREAVDADWVDARLICYGAFATRADRHERAQRAYMPSVGY